jgi:hypothetical protein
VLLGGDLEDGGGGALVRVDERPDHRRNLGGTGGGKGVWRGFRGTAVGGRETLVGSKRRLAWRARAHIG